MKSSVSRTAIQYAILTGLWILAFDLLSNMLISSQQRYAELHGALAVITVLLLYLLLSRELRAREQSNAPRHASQQHLANILDTVPDAIIVASHDYNILVFNRSAEHILGYRNQEILGQPLGVLLPTRLSEVDCHQDDDLATLFVPTGLGDHWREVLVRRKDGHEFLAEVSLSKLAQDGQTTFTIVLRDITRRKQAEQALRQAHDELEIRVQERTAELAQTNEALQAAEELLRDQVEELADSRQLIEIERQRYQDLFEFAPDGYLVTNPMGIIREANRAMAALLHIPQDLLVGKPLVVFVAQEGRKALGAKLLQLQMGEEMRSVTWEMRFQPRRDNPFHAALTVGPVYNAEGNLTSLRWLIRDITQRVQIEEEREHLLAQVKQQRQRAQELASTLERERDILQTIMENTHAHLAYLDPQFRFLRVNAAYAQGAGHSREELIGRNHFDLFPNDENQAIFERVRDTGQPIGFHAKPFEYADQPERGTTYWDWALVPVKDGDGHIQGLVFSLLDVTERKRAEEDLRNVLGETRQREAEISALLECARAVLAYRDFEDVARLIFDSCRNLLGAQTGSMILLTENGTDNEVVSWDQGGLSCKDGPTLPMPIRRLREEAFRTGKTIYENDFCRSEGTRFLPEGYARPDNVLFAPLLIKGITVGLLAMANKSGSFTENDARMASAFAEMAVIALFNSRTTESLEKSEERFRSVAQTACEAIISADSGGKIIFWNKAAATIFGLTADEAIGRPLICVMPERFQASHQKGIERLLSTGKPHIAGKTAEMVGLRKDGTEFPMELSLSIWKIGEETFFTGIIHDITDRKQAEEALRRAYDELELRVQERTALLQASHTMASTLDMEPLLGLILDQLKTVLDCAGATIYYLEGADLKTLAHRGLVPPKEALGIRFSLENVPIYHEMIHQRAPIIIPDVRGNMPLALVFQELVGERLDTTFGYVRSWMGVPLAIQERVIGMLSLHHSQPNYYTARHAELAMAFANQAAMAMENARLYEQAQELAVMQDRQRLSRDLHDSVSQALFSASLSAEVLPRLWERDPDKARTCLEELHRLTRGALAEMRTLLLELRPEALIKRELGELLRQLAEAITNRVQVPVTLTLEGHRPLPPEVHVTFYRIAQEALNNVAKHAGASQVAVSLRYPSFDREEVEAGVELCISDDGQGFNLDSISPQHLGLDIMCERAEAIGATFEIESQRGHGTRIAVVWTEGAGDEGWRTEDE
jgi:PAS domain S-box-containing protein